MRDWEGLDEFVAVATHGSFVKAAASLRLSRTHMSRAIVELEERLQVRLLHRTTRAVKLTETGEAFVERCRRLIEQRDEAIAEIAQAGDPHGELHVTCSTALGERYVAPIAMRLARENPRLQINLDLSNSVVDLVAEGFDLAIRTGHLPSSSLVATRIADRRLFTCASPDYLQHAGTPLTIDALAGHDCLVGTSSVWQFSEGGKETLYRPRARWRCNNGQAVLAAALDGMGICQLPDFYVREALANASLVHVLPRHKPPLEPIWAVYPNRRHLTPKVRHFVELLRAELPKMLADGAPA